jgi:hypothetical protein
MGWMREKPELNLTDCRAIKYQEIDHVYSVVHVGPREEETQHYDAEEIRDVHEVESESECVRLTQCQCPESPFHTRWKLSFAEKKLKVGDQQSRIQHDALHPEQTRPEAQMESIPLLYLHLVRPLANQRRSVSASGARPELELF